MSITPRPPPRSRRRVDRESRDAAPWYDRVLARLLSGLRGAGRWLRQVVGETTERRPGNRSAAGESTHRRPSQRALQPSDRAPPDKHEADVVARLPAGAVLDEPELPPRPDLELERTEDHLTIRRPEQDDAYIASDEWLDVKR